MNPKNLIIGSTLMVGFILSVYITLSEANRHADPVESIPSSSVQVLNRGEERITLKDGYSRIGNLQGIVPGSWRRETPSSSMRLAQFSFSDESGTSELVVFAGIGGSVDDNLDRWLGQFRRPDNESVADHATISHEHIGDMDVNFVYTEGTYLQAGMGMRGPTIEKPNYGLMAAIIKAPDGPYYFKCTGPKKVLDNYRNSFETFIHSIEPL